MARLDLKDNLVGQGVKVSQETLDLEEILVPMVLLDSQEPLDPLEIEDLQDPLENGECLDSLDLLVHLVTEELQDNQETKARLVLPGIQVIRVHLDRRVNREIEVLQVLRVRLEILAIRVPLDSLERKGHLETEDNRVSLGQLEPQVELVSPVLTVRLALLAHRDSQAVQAAQDLLGHLVQLGQLDPLDLQDKQVMLDNQGLKDPQEIGV